MNSRNLTVEVECTVEFYDIDPMEVVWHGNYVKYFEKARCALLDKIGYGYREMKASGYVFPVIDISLKFIKPLHFGDRVRIKAILDEYENRLRIRYELSRPETGEITTRGVSTQMACHISTQDSCFICPRIFTDKVEILLAQLDPEGSP
ncbi:MAG: acyl-CoA thioesterase [Spirochaetaceae bacterium]|jgi:acyl-CoA thioester hydrolase|nr:acyl-CoA thioesterase [Spirochaetaceae bacterium]